MIKGHFHDLVKVALDLHLRCSGGPIQALATTKPATVPISAMLWLDD
jgi:hypothetical protein